MKPFKTHGKSWEIRVEGAMTCKLSTKKRLNKLREIDSETTGSKKIQKNKACMHRGGSWIYEKSFGIDFIERSRRSHCGERVQFMRSL